MLRVREISLSQGMKALIDDDDFDLVSQFAWYAGKNHNKVYAMRTTYKNGRRCTEYMHHFLSGNSLTDHRNGDGLDNQRSNLRVATNKDNVRYAGISRRNKSGYKGVWWESRRARWRAGITVNRKRLHLGYFTDIEEAARAYDQAAADYFGEFAKRNFPEREDDACQGRIDSPGYDSYDLG